ncbi:PpiC-type peptidyl-prolyl cis-trans isomerase [Brachyspira pilosicoli WesB]|uniref:Periplasmic chaperone PpiD n=1 Tax=Brachyspira pilosicoli WesB TaxID=1161918 RepID=K0JJP1_BRAPL|nr:SurA N-terminal domain-containing protein [Brachyspira pilosicoli]PLV58813.1 peptidyl-prolyl cis-trans isomerase [Brachyspira pilosicoli SP16]CCG57122.1 PpiC-type peptidyl-prolyl cis-trans isomerase [Brachyspira pilosicoli WesB]
MSSNKKIVIKKKSPVVKTLQWLGVSAVSILLIVYFLVIDTRGSQKTPTIGSVNGTPIYYTSTSPYGKAFREIEKEIENYYQQFGIPMNADIYANIEDLAFRSAVTNILLDDLAAKNITVSDKLILQYMQSQFIDSNGNYNKMAYDAFIKNTPQSEKIRIEKDLKETVMAQTIALELFNSVKINSLELERDYIKNYTKRDIEMLYIDASDIVRNADILETDIDKYFNDNKTNFVQADISWILLANAKDAENVYKTLKNDITLFDKTVAEKSIYTNDYHLGYVTRMEIDKNIADRVFTNTQITTNTLLSPINVNGVYYVVLVNDIRLPEKYTDVNSGVLRDSYLNDNLKVLVEAEKSKQVEVLKNAVANNNNFAALNNNNNIKYYKSSAPFYYSQGFINSTDKNVIPDSSSPIFNSTVFSLNVGDKSEVIKLNNGVAVIKVLSEEKADINKLASLDTAQKNAMKRELLNVTVANISIEWENRSMEEAKIKRHQVR